MPHLWRMNKYQIPHLSPFWGSILAGTIFGAWIYQYWGSAEGYVWGKSVGKINMEKTKKKTGEKASDSLYANPDEDGQQLNGSSKHN